MDLSKTTKGETFKARNAGNRKSFLYQAEANATQTGNWIFIQARRVFPQRPDRIGQVQTVVIDLLDR